MSERKTLRELKQGQKKGWFKKFLERVAKANQQNGGQLCPS